MGISQQETAKEMKGLFSLLLTITGCLAAPMADDLGLEAIGLGEDKTDHRDIVELTKFVRDHLALDVKENRRFAERIGNQTEVVAKAILKHVNDLNRDSTKKFQETLTKLQVTSDENLGAIVNQTKENHEALEVQSRENDKHISEETSRNFNALLSGPKGRLSQHEQMLNTHVAVCAEQYNNIGYGPVTYQQTSMKSVIIGGDVKKVNILDPRQGEFVVPPGAEGTYQFSFTAIIDTLKGLDDTLAPASFVFTIRGAGGATAPTALSETTLTATVGQPGGDKAPASRSILLDLKAGEKVAIYQQRKRAESSYRLTFCAHLIRPTAPSAWEALTDPLPSSDPKIETENTYTAPEQKLLAFDDLHIDSEDPEVKMPAAKSALLFPKTNFFKKIPTGDGVPTPDPFLGDPLGAAGNPNDIPL